MQKLIQQQPFLGNYSIHGLNGEVQQVYCKMDANYCDDEGGWMRVAYVNMTEPGGTCPNGMTELAYNNINHTLCGSSPSAMGNCNSIFFPVNGSNYSKVCGQMRGYQYHSPDGFEGYLMVKVLTVTTFVDILLRMEVIHVNTSGLMLVEYIKIE